MDGWKCEVIQCRTFRLCQKELQIRSDGRYKTGSRTGGGVGWGRATCVMDVQGEYVGGGILEVTMQKRHLVNKARRLLLYTENLVMCVKPASRLHKNDFTISMRESSDECSLHPALQSVLCRCCIISKPTENI